MTKCFKNTNKLTAKKMHIPDGFLNNGVSSGLLAAVVVVLSVALKKLRQGFFEKVPAAKLGLATEPAASVDSSVGWQSKLTKQGQEKIWRMATVGAFIFAAQMVNFPVLHGTSGHLLGGVLAAVVCGPLAGLVVITAVLLVQALMFGDGGVLALGANIFNMGVIGVLLGYVIYKFVANKLQNYKRGILVASFVAAWASVVLASVGASVELALSGAQSLSVVLPAMVGVHAVIGVGEGIITVAVVGWLLKKGVEVGK